MTTNNAPPAAKIVNPAQATKRKQWLLTGTVFVILIATVSFGIGLFDAPPPPEKGYEPTNGEQRVRPMTGPGAGVDEKVSWRGKADQQLGVIESRQTEHDKELADLRKLVVELKEKGGTQAAEAALKSKLPASIRDTDTELTPPVASPKKGSGLTQAQSALAAGGQKLFENYVGQPKPAQGAAASANGMPNQPPAELQRPLPGYAQEAVDQGPRIVNVSIKEIPPKSADAVADKAASKTKKVFIPPSFTPIVMLSGVDAPTGGQAQQDPFPVMFRITDKSFLPNKFRADLRECLGLGEARGDLSTERAIIRAVSISCTKRNGESFELRATGHIVGSSDGKPGLRGRVVEKQGQVLANGLIASMFSGIGGIMQAQSQVTNATAFGTTSTVDPAKSFQSAAGQGLNRAMDRLAQYYIQMADKIFPVIEVDAGRTGELVLTKGMEIELPNEDLISGDMPELAQRNQEVSRFNRSSSN